VADDPAALAARMNEVVQKGRAEYPDFDTAAGYVVSMSADQMELRHALGELGDDAHRVVARLADDPDEAARLLALRGSKLGAALGKFAAKAATSAAPKPAATQAEPKPKPKAIDLYDPNLSKADFNAELDRREREKRGVREERAKSYMRLMRK
jgi:hypothetical protein